MPEIDRLGTMLILMGLVQDKGDLRLTNRVKPAERQVSRKIKCSCDKKLFKKCRPYHTYFLESVIKVTM